MRGHGRNSDPNLIDPSSAIKNGHKNTKQFKKNNRSINGVMNVHSDDEDDYIVGPESNHSTIKKRPLNGGN